MMPIEIAGTIVALFIFAIGTGIALLVNELKYR